MPKIRKEKKTAMWVDRGDKIGKTNDFQFLKLVFFFFSSVFKLTSENGLQLFLHVKRTIMNFRLLSVPEETPKMFQ